MQEDKTAQEGKQVQQRKLHLRRGQNRRTLLEVMKHDTKGLVVKHHIPVKDFSKRKEQKELAYIKTLESLKRLRDDAESRKTSPRQMTLENYEYSLKLIEMKVYNQEKIEQGILYEYGLLFHFGSSYRNEHLTMKQGYKNAIHDIEFVFDKLMW